MRPAALLAAIAFAAATARCTSGSGDAPSGSSAPAITLSIPTVKNPRPPPSPPREKGLIPPAASASPEDHIRALGLLLERGEAKDLGVEAADTGWAFDPDLRRILMRAGARDSVVELEPPLAAGIDAAAAAAVLKSRLPRIRRCYERGLASNPTLKGRVVVALTIDASGAVSASKKESTDLPDGAVADCIVRLGESFAFPSGPAKIVFGAKLSASN